jgi:hypothetical protein
MRNNSWTNNFYHDSTGKILGSIMTVDSNKYKALIDNLFIGWYISEDFAKSAVEEAHKNGIKNAR